MAKTLHWFNGRDRLVVAHGRLVLLLATGTFKTMVPLDETAMFGGMFVCVRPTSKLNTTPPGVELVPPADAVP